MREQCFYMCGLICCVVVINGLTDLFDIGVLIGFDFGLNIFVRCDCYIIVLTEVFVVIMIGN